MRHLFMLSAVLACGDNGHQNRAPVLADGAPSIVAKTWEGGSVTIDVQASDPDGDALAFTASAPAHGKVTKTTERRSSASQFVYTPEPNYGGADTFTIAISDGEATSTVPVFVTIGAVNDAPVAMDLGAETTEAQGVPIVLRGYDVDSDDLTFSLVSEPAHGTITGVFPNITYTPSSHYHGADTFSYKASDGSLDSNIATVTIDVTNVLTCGDGIVEGTEQCDDANANELDACLANCMAAACGDGHVQAGVEACDDGNGVESDGCLGSCTLASCGDGVVQAGVEGCDDGNSDNTDGCVAGCVVAACGDGFVQTGTEACDDGNPSSTDTCLPTCVSASCGDGVVQAGVEACDDGNANDSDGCLSSCAAATCGDGIVQFGIEQCDDGNANNTDGCLNTCMTPSCGDGFVRAGIEQCDDGNASDGDACLTTCAAATCGDGFVRAGAEQCDDANASETDACLTTCALPSCGDGFVYAGVEACDDGNQSNIDGCLATCAVATCGDGFVRPGVEACDDGNAANTDGCLATCAAASCGDGFLQLGVEQCDDANGDNTDGCLATCSAATCGDGFVRAGLEQCDDANASNTDGCLNTCASPTCGDGFAQAGVEACDDANADNSDACLDSCVLATCGDGVVELGVEQCDDGNADDTDLCLSTCEASAPAVCGDGALAPGEACDDANTADGDGCGHSCMVEGCGDGLVQFALGEQCDDGNAVDGDGCTSCTADDFVTTTPGPISAALSCTTANANAARRISVDGSGRLYVSMKCGTEGYMVTSSDRGATFSAPQNVTADLPNAPVTVSEISTSTGNGIVYVAIMLNTGVIYLRSSEDSGVSWSEPVLVGTASSATLGLSLQSFNDDIYLGYRMSGGVVVARNHTRGQGTFETTAVAMTVSYFDLVYDVVTSMLIVASDNPSFHIRASSDEGVTFASEVNPPGNIHYSDWAVGAGKLYVAGTGAYASALYVIDTSDLTQSTLLTGLPSTATSRSRSVAADAAGNAFISSQVSSVGVRLDHLPVGTTTFDTPRVLHASGTHPVSVPLPGNQGVAVVFTVGTSVYATVQTY